MRILVSVLLLLSGAAAVESPRAQAWKVLDAAVADKSTDKRVKAMRALVLLRHDARAIALARLALHDDQPVVREAAANALGQMHAHGEIPSLRELLDDHETSVVLAAANALNEMQDKSAYRVYFSVLTGARKTGHGVIVDQAKILKDRKKMAEMGLEQGLGFVPFAGMGYSAVRALKQDDVSPVRAEAAEALALDPDPDSGQALLEATKDKSWLVRAAALSAIAKRGDTKMITDILPALADQKDSVRYTAAAAILRLSSIAPPRVSTPSPE